MKFGRYIRFAISVIVSTLILFFFTYDAQRIAFLRLGNAIWSASHFKESVAKVCDTLVPASDSANDKIFVEKFGLSSSAKGARECRVTVAASHMDRFQLRSRWNFLARIEPTGGGSRLEKHFLVEFPEPLCLLPFVIFLLMLLFGFHHWHFSWLIALYLFMLGGLNVSRLGTILGNSAWLAVGSDQTFIGLLFFIAWATLVKSIPVTPTPSKPWENTLSRAVYAVIGLWNPTAYTVLGRLLFPFRKGLTRVVPFLESQCLVAALSLYLFSYDFKSYGDFFYKNLLLPRYFTFTVALFFLIRVLFRDVPEVPPLWHLRRFLRALFLVVTVETLAYFFPSYNFLTTFPRIAGALLISELLSFQFDLKSWATHFFPWAGVAAICSLIPAISQESGVVDLALTLCDPRLHPAGLVFFTFVSSAVLGFFTGSFSATFFAFLSLMGKSTEMPLIKAALLDGTVTGILLSPFSPFNLFAAMQFGIRLQELVAYRFKALVVPCLIASVVYIVAAVNSVRVLQPITFVSLCLIAVAWQLRKRDWIFKEGNIDNFGPAPHNASH
jgi:hypothetical protein